MRMNEYSMIMVFVGNMTLIGLVAIIGGFLHYRRERLLTHQERMKALELGRALPDDAATARIKATFGVGSSDDEAEGEGKNPSLAGKCISTAVWVGIGGFLAASQGGSASTAIAIAGSAGAIGVTSLICGTILALRMPSASPPGVAAKPLIESDAFDVVSSRG